MRNFRTGLAMLVALPVALSMVAVPSFAVIVTLSTNADSYLRGSAENTNVGTETLLRVRKTGPNRSLVRFDQAALVSATTGTLVQSATLELFVEFSTSTWGSGREIDVHRLTTDWSETGVTWNCPIDTAPLNLDPDCAVQWAGGSFVATATDSYLHTDAFTGVVQLDVTADVQAFVSGTNNFGWILKKRDEGQNGLLEYTSREGTANQEAKLILDLFILPTATPTPTFTDTPTPTSTPTPTDTATPTPTFTPDPNCATGPIIGCRQSTVANKSLLLLKDKGGARDKLVFKWIKGESTDIADFGDPVNGTTYSLCLYDQNAGVSSLILEAIVPPGGVCNDKPCWKTTKRGFKFRDPALANDGVKVITLKSGTSGKAKIVLRGKGPNLNVPALPLMQDQTVIAQIKNNINAGECWEARFSGPSKANEAAKFKDKGDAPITFAPTNTPTSPPTATPTPAGPTFTPSDTPTPGAPTATATPTSTPLPGLGTYTCTLDSSSRLTLVTEASPVGVTPNGSIEIDCSATDANGVSMCTCDLIQIDAIPLLGLGDVCVAPAGPCPAAKYDCDGGTALDLDLYADHNVGSCTSQASCSAVCDTFCSGLSASHQQQSSSCEGYCMGGSNHEAACTQDADCPGGNCPGKEPVQGGAHAGVCNCSCLALEQGAAGAAGAFSCNLGLAITVERDNDQICGNFPPSITLSPLCGSLTSTRSDGVLEHVNNKSGGNNDLGPFDLSGAGLACTDYSAGNLSGLSLTGYLAFYDSSLGDILAQGRVRLPIDKEGGAKCPPFLSPCGEREIPSHRRPKGPPLDSLME